MRHASLFSGIGGAEIAASWLGWENIFHVEINPFGQKVLEYWYPKSISYGDITKTDFTPWRGKIDILTGGFPCQAFSVAGLRKGADDDRYLWPEMLRAIREIQPRWVVGENVTGLLSMVQPGEEVEVGSTGDIFEENYIYRTEQRFTIDEICEGLECAGYEVQPFVIPACAVGAPHRRDRVWIIARLATHTSRNGDSGRPGAVREEVGRQDYELRAEPFEHGGLQTMATSDTDEHRHTSCRPCEGTERSGRIIADTHNKGLQGKRISTGHDEKKREESGRHAFQYTRDDRRTLPADRWKNFPTQSPVCSRDDELSSRLVGITFPKWRAEAIKALGNAWCVAVAYEIFRAINEIENGDK